MFWICAGDRRSSRHVDSVPRFRIFVWGSECSKTAVIFGVSTMSDYVSLRR